VMQYKTDWITIIEFWLPLFTILSVEKFKPFLTIVNCPTDLSSDLPDIAKQFSLFVLPRVNIPIPQEIPVSNIPDAELEISELLVGAWNYTFERLALIGDADKIYDWGERIQAEQKLFANYDGQITNWISLLLYWVQEEENNFTTLNLSQKTQSKIKTTFNHHVQWYQSVRSSIAQIPLDKNNRWEEYVLKATGHRPWLTNVCYFYIFLAMWKSILCDLSDREKSALDKWGEQNMHHISNSTYFSLSTLADQLCKGTQIHAD
jgi:hypothetical protein